MTTEKLQQKQIPTINFVKFLLYRFLFDSGHFTKSTQEERKSLIFWDVPRTELMYLVFTWYLDLVFIRMPGESYRTGCTSGGALYLFTRMPGESYRTGCTSGGAYVPCLYTHAR